MKASNRSTIHQNSLGYYCKVITGNGIRTENLEENIQFGQTQKSVCSSEKSRVL